MGIAIYYYYRYIRGVVTMEVWSLVSLYWAGRLLFDLRLWMTLI